MRSSTFRATQSSIRTLCLIRDCDIASRSAVVRCIPSMMERSILLSFNAEINSWEVSIFFSFAIVLAVTTAPITTGGITAPCFKSSTRRDLIFIPVFVLIGARCPDRPPWSSYAVSTKPMYELRSMVASMETHELLPSTSVTTGNSLLFRAMFFSRPLEYEELYGIRYTCGRLLSALQTVSAAIGR